MVKIMILPKIVLWLIYGDSVTHKDKAVHGSRIIKDAVTQK